VQRDGVVSYLTVMESTDLYTMLRFYMTTGLLMSSNLTGRTNGLKSIESQHILPI
jgi:hypothetical protein